MSDERCSAIATQLSQLCAEHYRRRLTKKGKPQQGCEWTVLSAIVVTWTETGKLLIAG